jgi:serine phosphatase RsbU (regulator of sigma subunit)
VIDNILRQIALFAGLPPEEIKRIASAMRWCQFEEGAILFREGDVADRMYVLIEGRVAIIKGLGSSSERTLALYGTGSFLGEMALFDPGSQRSATARAIDDVHLLEMSHAELDVLLHRHPTLAYEMIRVISARLHQANNQTMQDLRERNLQLTHAYRDLEAAQAKLIDQQKIEHELQVAKDIQRSLLPRCLPRLPGYEFGARMVPARAVGGDFFDFFPLSEHSVGILIGDVSDKGVPAALFMALTSSLLRAEARRGSSAAEALRNVNRDLMEKNDMGMFVTAWYGVLDARTRELQYVRAGHELPLFCNRAGELAALPCTRGVPLGIADEIPLDQQAIRLEPGSTLLVYTDGITDALDSTSTRFGLERLRTAFAELHRENAPVICSRLIEMNAAFRGDTPQYDDIALIAVQATELPDETAD